MSQFFTLDGQGIATSASASVLPMNIQGWFPLELTGLIPFQSKWLSRVLQHNSSKPSILQHSTLFIVQLSHPYMTTGKNIALTIWTFVGKVMSVLFNMLPTFVAIGQFYEDLQDLLEVTHTKNCPFHHRGLKCKSRKSRDTWSNRQVWPWSTKWSSAKANSSFSKRMYWL